MHEKERNHEGQEDEGQGGDATSSGYYLCRYLRNVQLIFPYLISQFLMKLRYSKQPRLLAPNCPLL